MDLALRVDPVSKARIGERKGKERKGGSEERKGVQGRCERSKREWWW